MLIKIGTEFTTTIRGFQTRSVHCVHCAEHYLYDLMRKGKGHRFSLFSLDNAGSRQGSAGDAQEDLDVQLRHELDPIPCPSCGCYQPDMVERLKKQAWEWLFWLAVVSFTIGLAAAGLLSVAKKNRESLVTTSSISIVLGGSFLLFRRVQQSHYDPNAGDEKPRQKASWLRAYRLQDEARLRYDRQYRLAAEKGRDLDSRRRGHVLTLSVCSIALLGLGGRASLSAVSDAVSILQSSSHVWRSLRPLAPQLLCPSAGLACLVLAWFTNRSRRKVSNVIRVLDSRQTWRIEERTATEQQRDLGRMELTSGIPSQQVQGWDR